MGRTTVASVCSREAMRSTRFEGSAGSGTIEASSESAAPARRVYISNESHPPAPSATVARNAVGGVTPRARKNAPPSE